VKESGIRNQESSICVLLSAVTMSKAQVQFGAGLQFLKPDIGSSFGIGAEVLFALNEDYALNPSFHYYFEEGNSLAIDVDVHYTRLLINDSVRLNPFAGLNLVNASEETELGINLGLHVQAPINENFEFYVEPKLIIISSLNGYAIGAGVLF